MSGKDYDDIVPKAYDEMDLPHFSGYTGYMPDSPSVWSRSVYQYLY